MQRNAENCIEMGRDAEKCREMQRTAEKYKIGRYVCIWSMGDFMADATDEMF